MAGLTTSYEFTLPRGYLDGQGRLHRTGTMRLATARDELDPLRDPSVTGPDDPRLTIFVLARVVESLGDVELVTSHEIENLFAVDLAFLQDFYGVINFGSQEEYEELIRSQQESTLLGDVQAAPAPAPARSGPADPAPDDLSGVDWSSDSTAGSTPPVRAAVEELRRSTL